MSDQLKTLLQAWAKNVDDSFAAVRLAREIAAATGVSESRAMEWVGALQLAVCHPELCRMLHGRSES